MGNYRLEDAKMQLQALLSERSYTSEQIAETALHALYPTLSEGAANTFHQLGRGAVLMDLRDLVEGKLNTNYLPSTMLERMNAEVALFDQAIEAVARYNPLNEFVVIVWQESLITVFRLDQL